MGRGGFNLPALPGATEVAPTHCVDRRGYWKCQDYCCYREDLSHSFSSPASICKVFRHTRFKVHGKKSKGKLILNSQF